MANLQGYTQSSVSDILNHYTRHDGAEDQTDYTYQNQNIDPQRTHLNRVLRMGDDGEVVWDEVRAGSRTEAEAAIDSRIAEVDRRPGKNTNVLSDWVVTLPRRAEFDDDGAAMAAGFRDTGDARRAFFDESFRFLSDLVGRENVVGAWIHMDETRPHMHFAFTPVTTEPGSTSKGEPLYWSEKDARKYEKKVWTKAEADKFSKRVWTKEDKANFPDAPIKVGDPRCVAGKPKCVAGMPKLDSKCSPRFKRVKKGNAKTVTRFAQTAKFDQDYLKVFHQDFAGYMDGKLGFDVGITLDGDDELGKLDQSLSRIKDQKTYAKAKEVVKSLAKEASAAKSDADRARAQQADAEKKAASAVAVHRAAEEMAREAKGEARAARDEKRRAEDDLKEITAQIEEERRRLESVRRAREGAEERVGILEAVLEQCRAADGASERGKGTALDKVAAICSGFLKRLGVAVEAVKETVKRPLRIIQKHTAVDDGIAEANKQRSRASGGLAGQQPFIRTQPQAQPHRQQGRSL